MSERFAFVSPVGSGSEETARMVRLVASVVRNEPDVGWIVLVDDDMSKRNLGGLIALPKHCTLVVLDNPRYGDGIGHLGGLFVGIMRGLQWVAEHTTASFVLKLDTDSLVIRPFARDICEELDDNKSIGEIGTIGCTCNRNATVFGYENQYVSPLVQMESIWRDTMLHNGKNQNIFEYLAAADVKYQHLMEHLAAADLKYSWIAKFDLIRPAIAEAIQNGYKYLKYCQGGAYSISAEMLKQMLKASHFDTYNSWKYIPAGEDVIMSMHVFSLGMQLKDRSEIGQTFGLHWKGLPFSPKQLLSRGYSIIHSVKNDPHYSENQLVDYFTHVHT
jgi:hypothetical protein